MKQAGLDGSFGPVVAQNSEVLGSNSGQIFVIFVDIYTVLETVQRYGVCGVVYTLSYQ